MSLQFFINRNFKLLESHKKILNHYYEELEKNTLLNLEINPDFKIPDIIQVNYDKVFASYKNGVVKKKVIDEYQNIKKANKTISSAYSKIKLENQKIIEKINSNDITI